MTQPSKIALIVVDIQYDFLETGTLPVPHASDIIPKAQRLISFIESMHGLVVATQDWHPKNHKSFASNHAGKQIFDTVDLTYQDQSSTQVLWPDHCIQDTPGASLVAEISSIPLVVQKGTNPEIDSYSGFADNEYHAFTDLSKHLHQHDIQTVVICGLATDYCVKMTCLDAVKFGFRTLLIQDATKPVVAEDFDGALANLRSRGVHIVPTTDDFVSHSDHYL